MKRTLRRTSDGVSISYSGGVFSNNLRGTDFAWEEVDGSICLSIDLSGNFRVRQKSASCYQDACDLAENASNLKTVHLDWAVAAKLVPIRKRFSDAEWRLELNLGQKGTFEYSVTHMTRRPGTLFMNVSEPQNK